MMSAYLDALADSGSETTMGARRRLDRVLHWDGRVRGWCGR